MQGEERKAVIDSAQDSYKLAGEAAEHLKTTHPIRLGLALNYSVFYYEILNSPDKNDTRNFDLLVAHLLGIDHAGHTFHANHSEIERKVVDT